MHKNVIRAIENLPKDEFNRLNFEPVKYEDTKGEKRPMYLMTRDGFSMIVMGFTGIPLGSILSRANDKEQSDRIAH